MLFSNILLFSFLSFILWLGVFLIQIFCPISTRLVLSNYVIEIFLHNKVFSMFQFYFIPLHACMCKHNSYTSLHDIYVTELYLFISLSAFFQHLFTCYVLFHFLNSDLLFWMLHLPSTCVYLITECLENTHSFSCISCPPNCINGCSAVDGTCNDCKKGQFGRMCHRDCHHVCSDGTCDRNEGRCSQGIFICCTL